MPNTKCKEVPPTRPVVLAGFESILCAWDGSLEKWTASIVPGEFYIASSDEAITTVLGSCVAVCIRDKSLQLGGMNNFMLPDDTKESSAWMHGIAGLAMRHGAFAIETLINGLMKMGARRERLEVKLFGGGQVLKAAIDAGERNTSCAKRWLKTEGFILAAEDIGARVSRRIVYLPETGKVRIRHLGHVESLQIATHEQQHLEAVTRKPVDSDTELF
jgi:chemotaxis protein CheD